MADKAKAEKQKAVDDTALDAVEQALSIDFDEIDDLSAEELETLEKSLAETAEELRSSGTTSSRKEDGDQSDITAVDDDIDALPKSPPMPANDQHAEELRNLLYEMQQKPKSGIFPFATLLTLTWFAGCALYGYAYTWPQLEKPVDMTTILSNRSVLVLLAVTFLPVLPLWAFAAMLRRAQEMRHAARNMTKAALRLLQPEKIASDSVATVGTAIRREMTAIGDGVERAIARAGELEFMVQKEVLELERAYGDSEFKLQRLVEDIGNERREVITHAEELRNAITAGQMGLTKEIEIASTRIEETIRDSGSLITENLDSQGISLSATLRQTSTELMELLASTGEQISTSLGTGRQELGKELVQHTREFASMISTSGEALATLIDRRTQRFDETSAEINDKLETGKRAFETAFTDKTNELNSVLVASGQTVADQLKAGSQSLAEQNEALAAQLDDQHQKMTSTLSQHTQNMGETTRQATETLTSRLDEQHQTMTSTLSEYTENLGTTAQKANETLTARLDEQHQAMTTTLSQHTRNLEATAEQAVDSIAEKIDAGTERMFQQADKIATQVEDNIGIRAADFEHRLNDSAESVEERLSQRFSEIDASLKSGNEALVTSLTASGESLFAALGMRTEALNKVLQDRTQAIGDTIAERLSGFGQSLTGHVDHAVTNLKEQTDTLTQSTELAEQVISGKTRQVEEAIKQGTIDFAASVKENLDATTAKSEELSSALEQASRSLDSTVAGNLSRLGNTFETTATQIAASLESGNERVAETTRNAEETITRAIESTATGIAASLESGNERIAETTRNAEENITRAISGETEKLVSAFSEQVSGFNSTVADKTSTVETVLGEGTAKLTRAFTETADEAAGHMEREVAKLEKRLDEHTGSIDLQFAAGTKIMDETMARGRDNLAQSISQSIQNAGSTIDEKAGKISALLSERASVINETLGGSLLETQRKLENSTADLNSLLSSRSSELIRIIEEEAKPVIDSIDESGQKAHRRLVDTAASVSDQANVLFAELNQHNEQLNSLIDAAGSNLGLMQNKLEKQSGEFQAAIVASGNQIEDANRLSRDFEANLTETSTSLINNLANIASRLEAQGALLQDATVLIDRAQSGFEETLGRNEHALTELSTGLLNRTEQINASVGSFASSINTALETLRNDTANTGSALAGELSSAIDDATSRFGDSVDAMRAAAATIRQELESTRDEMRRGVLELPEETAQNASAMRRVVTDQIAALRDLSSIVERSGKMLDVASSERAKRVAAVSAPSLEPAPAPRAASRPAASFPPDTRPGQGFDTRASAPPPRPAAQRPADPRPVQQDPGNSGWVSELLRRASTGETEPRPAPAPQPDPRSPDQFVESLNSLSLDIASAIDHEASVELWDRYQRGETNVFTRRLYTLQGQQTFDEIRAKYGRDRDFREAVDRYIDDFERLLGDVSRNDQGGQTAQRYLTSDTGKVYTMLAHASGRFDRV